LWQPRQVSAPSSLNVWVALGVVSTAAAAAVSAAFTALGATSHSSVSTRIPHETMRCRKSPAFTLLRLFANELMHIMTVVAGQLIEHDALGFEAPMIGDFLFVTG
jgi:hypothetical protein